MLLADAWRTGEQPQGGYEYTPKRRRDLEREARKESPDLVQDIELGSSIDSRALQELWEDEMICDVICRAGDGQTAKAHKIVLAASSPFFRALFVGAGANMQEGHAQGNPQQQVDLPGIEGPTLSRILEAIYSGKVQVTPDNIHSLLAGSSLLQATAVFNACTEYLRSHVTVSNCLEVLDLATTYGTEELKAEARSFVCSNFAEVIRVGNGASWRSASHEIADAVLGCEDLIVSDSELDVFQAVVDWVGADEGARLPLLPQLLSRHVRLPLLPPACLLRQVAAHPLVAVSPEATSLVREAAASSPSQGLTVVGDGLSAAFEMETGRQQSSSLPPFAASPSSSASSSWSYPGIGSSAVNALEEESRPRRAVATGIMVMGGHDAAWHSLRTSEIYDIQAGTWQPGPVLPSSMTPGLSFVSSAAVNGRLYAIGGSSFHSPVAVLDRQDQQHGGGSYSYSWAPASPLLTPRVNMAAATCAGLLFALGGRTGAGVGQVLATAEYLDVAAGGGAWQRLSAGMPTARNSLGAAAVDGVLYAVGGQASRTIFETVDSLDVGTGTWRTVQAPMRHARKYVSVVAAEGRLFAIGGMNGQRERLATVEVFDPREGIWRAAGTMQAARSSAGVVSLHSRLYAIGGHGCGDLVHDSTEVYEPAMDIWRPAAMLPSPRTGLGVAAIV